MGDILRARCAVGPAGRSCDGSTSVDAAPCTGEVFFSQPKEGGPTTVEYNISGLSPGLHGFHIHEKADFSQGCKSAGGHWNPHSENHGDVADAPRCHAGDLGNISANEDGVAQGKITTPLLDLAGELSIIGRSVMIHADEDDLGKGDHSEPGVNGKTSLTTGNAGARVACGEIQLVDGDVAARNVTTLTESTESPKPSRSRCCTCCFSVTSILVILFLVYVGFTMKTFAGIAVPGGFEGFTYQRDADGNIVNTIAPYAYEGMTMDFEAYLTVEHRLTSQSLRQPGTTLVWKVEDVPWDFSNPEGQLFETSLRREDVGEDMWSKFTKGQAFIHLLGREKPRNNVLTSAMTTLVHETMIARVIRKPQYRLLRPWLGDCGCGDGVSTVEAEDAAVLLAKEVELVESNKPTPHWKPNATFQMAVDFTEYPLDQVPGLVARHLVREARTGKYRPIVYHDDMWATSDKMLPLNETVTEVPLTISIIPASFGRWQLGQQMGEALVLMEAAMGATDKEKDDIKRLITDTNPVLLISILLVSLLHMLFDTLAFKNDIQFWKNLDKMEGLSGRAQTGSLVFQVIILAYLHHEESSILVLAPAFFGVAVQAWKCVKVIRLTGFNEDTSTTEADEVAYQYLSKLLIPFVIGFAIYSCHCETHEGWYSMILSTAVQTVYILGFIVMTPQLFINYKKKSVAALPWRMLVYRTLNTFIDDLFAFVIKMPTMHRLSCFRDDIVFFIYLYQRWLYPIDHSRPVLGVELEQIDDQAQPNNSDGAALESKKDD